MKGKDCLSLENEAGNPLCSQCPWASCAVAPRGVPTQGGSSSPAAWLSRADAFSALGRLQGQPSEPRGAGAPRRKDPTQCTKQNGQQPRINLKRKSKVHTPFSRKESRGQQGPRPRSLSQGSSAS